VAVKNMLYVRKCSINGMGTMMLWIIFGYWD